MLTHYRQTCTQVVFSDHFFKRFHEDEQLAVLKTEKDKGKTSNWEGAVCAVVGLYDKASALCAYCSVLACCSSVSCVFAARGLV